MKSFFRQSYETQVRAKGEMFFGIHGPSEPARPDHTKKRIRSEMLDAESKADTTFTESFAMLPAASVSGLYFTHREARYFAVEQFTRDQIETYAQRKEMELSEIERWLSPNLGYEPS